jgi:aspartyl-tRNA(Asn)/glutamyl-tRNA(Gln) amidotransferase subunit A
VNAAALARRLRDGELTPREAVEATLERIEAVDPVVNAYVTVRAEEALAEADALGTRADDRPLWGVPVALKDVIDVAGTPTTCGSRVLGRSRVPQADAHVTARLREAGAVVVGKLNTHEFAYGAMTTSPYPGPARNPWALDRIAGGSSGGSGVAVAADMAPATLGTDTAGSIRIPAAFNGVTGVRPTWGRVSNRGVFPVSWSFDTVGPLARSAEDCALVLQAVAGHDPGDPATAAVAVAPYHERLDGGVAGLRIGLVRRLFEHPLLDTRVGERTQDALAELERAGARLVEVEIDLLEHFGVIQQCTQFVDAAAVHSEWLRTRLGNYGDDVRARLLAGLFLPPTVYVLGQRGRRLAAAAYRRTLAQVDVLAAPTLPVLPPRIGEDTVELADGERILYRLTVIPYGSPWSCVGAPVVSVPAGFVDGMPVGLSLVGRPFGEEVVLRAAHTYQRLTDWHAQRPPLPASAPAAP